MKIEFEFLQITGTNGYLKRAKVFGGWLVLYQEDAMTKFSNEEMPSSGWEWRPTLTFVPDINHEWQ